MTDDRTFRRRRLASLAGVLALVLAVGSLVGGGQDGTVDVAATASAADAVVRTASLGSPSGVRELLSETTTTLVEATGATTTTTEAPSTSVPPATTAPAEVASEPASEPAPTEDTSASAVRALAVEDDGERTATSEAPGPEPTTTTAPPRTSPTTTAPPTTTTTAPPSDSGGYAYDDPRSTQVWYDLAKCESGGNWSIDTGNGYYGGLQFSLPTWESVGGTGYPHEHPAATQIEHGRRLQARQGWGAWPHCSEKLGLR